MFAVQVAAVRHLCPSVLRVTFTGDDLDRFADNGFDQRIKFFLPLESASYDELLSLEDSGDWYGHWRSLPDDRRHPMRTYTARAVRHDRREVDVDVVLHGDLGPASRWALTATPGDELVLAGPNAAASGPHGGVDFVPPAVTDRLLIAGDETALPAIAGILERLPDDSRGEALIEMPSSADRIDLAAPAGMTIRWLGRDGRAHGDLLVPAVRAAAARMLPGQAPAYRVELEDVDEDHLWEVPVDEDGRPLREMAAMYAWLAGESGVIKTLRRHLVTECGVDRKAVAFMGYWRRGKSETA
ncbi:siderophore-interacting protein [Cellulomonas edaphi]|uniref:Siderophore-interacting protein n=1 Tax=Cellulomonas edaphi TaxID=3053468 RepID=A0ABT7S3T0_9CELL|nr:siderophore-interacting protein [Cellulomons edaphi]MDM7830270.1 siderophore-interacting protein [Cellulomons edaphi]